MTNGSRIRQMGDDKLCEFIFKNCNAFVKCSMCTVGLDERNWCRDPSADCEEKIYEWLEKES